VKYQDNVDYSHKGENCHSKKSKIQEESDNEKLFSNLRAQIKDELDEHEKEQQILLKQNKQNIIDFIIDNKKSIRVEDLKTCEPIYKCYQERGNCFYCNTITNIICANYNKHNNEIWLCTNHWQEHEIEKHE
jgi:hypothetical protein